MFAPDAEGFSAISIHAPRMGSDPVFWHGNHPASEFQSTLPGWGATGTRYNTAYSLLFQSTLPGWGATHCGIRGCRPVVISIHAPRMGSDWFHVSGVPKMAFQSTLPGWGATESSLRWDAVEYFNPRSPDGERRGRDVRPRLRLRDFNPRSPDGERLDVQGLATVFQHFNPRSPDGERLVWGWVVRWGRSISIHAPRMGSDCSARLNI